MMNKTIGKRINNLLGKWENFFSNNWFNPFATLYINLRSFPRNQALKFPIYVYGKPRFCSLKGKMHIDGKIKSGMIKVNKSLNGVPSNCTLRTEIINDGLITFHGSGFIGTGNRIRVHNNAHLELGFAFKISDMINIGCYAKIKIGNSTRIAHRCQILDTNYHYLVNLNNKTVPPIDKPICIGNYCWIGNNATIMNGAVIPDYTIVTSNSLVNKNFSSIPSFSLIGGIPAKLISSGFRRIENQSKIQEITNHYKNSSDFYVIPDGIDLESFFTND